MCAWSKRDLSMISLELLFYSAWNFTLSCTMQMRETLKKKNKQKIATDISISDICYNLVTIFTPNGYQASFRYYYEL